MSRNFMDLSRALKSLADAFHTIKLKLDGLYDSAGAIGNKYELIEEITLTEAVSIIERTTEPDTTPYNFSKMFIDVYTPSGVNPQYLRVYINSDASQLNVIPSVTAAAEDRYSWIEIFGKGLYHSISKMGTIGRSAYSYVYSSGQFKVADKLTALKLQVQTDPLPIGSIISIYAVRN